MCIFLADKQRQAKKNKKYGKVKNKFSLFDIFSRFNILYNLFHFIYFYPQSSGGYWVRRMRQLPRAPPNFGASLENSTYIFVSLQMFFKGHYEVGTKSGRYKIDSRRRPFFLENSLILGAK